MISGTPVRFLLDGGILYSNYHILSPSLREVWHYCWVSQRSYWNYLFMYFIMVCFSLLPIQVWTVLPQPCYPSTLFVSLWISLAFTTYSFPSLQPKPGQADTPDPSTELNQVPTAQAEAHTSAGSLHNQVSTKPGVISCWWQNHIEQDSTIKSFLYIRNV